LVSAYAERSNFLKRENHNPQTKHYIPYFLRSIGAFQFVVAGGFSFQGIKGSEMGKRQIELHLYKAIQLKKL